MMRLRMFLTVSAAVALGAAGVAAAPIPREAPALTVTDVTGQEQDLSQFKGDVMVVEFMLTRCSGCLKTAMILDKLYGEMGKRGLAPVSVVFDKEITAPVVSDLAKVLKLKYPVGYTTSAEVDRFLARAEPERFQLPQVVVIDRAGVIRAQSHAAGEMLLLDEGYLRNLFGTLLDERAPQAAK